MLLCDFHSMPDSHFRSPCSPYQLESAAGIKAHCIANAVTWWEGKITGQIECLWKIVTPVKRRIQGDSIVPLADMEIMFTVLLSQSFCKSYFFFLHVPWESHTHLFWVHHVRYSHAPEGSGYPLLLLECGKGWAGHADTSSLPPVNVTAVAETTFPLFPPS